MSRAFRRDDLTILGEYLLLTKKNELINRFCNFMHLCHPTRSLVSALQASQRVSRRRAHKGAEVDSGDMGWTPAVAAGGEGDLGWMPERRY